MTRDDQHLTDLPTLKAWLNSSLKDRLQDGISSVVPTVQGSGYTSATASITDPTGVGALITPVVTAGSVAGYNIVSPGNNYSAPVVTVSGDGSGAQAQALIGVDVVLTQLITDVSAAVIKHAHRERLYDDGNWITEVRNGNGKSEILTRHRPINAVSSVAVFGRSIPPSDGTSAGYLFDVGVIYLVGWCFNRGPQNVRLVYKAGEAVGSIDAANAERAALMTAAYWFKKAPDAHLTSQSAPQGMGVSIGIMQRDFPPDAETIIENLRPKYYAA